VVFNSQLRRICKIVVNTDLMFQDEIDYMDSRLLDVIISVLNFCILVVLLALLPMVMEPGVAYLTAITIFIVGLSGAGYLVNKQIA